MPISRRDLFQGFATGALAAPLRLSRADAQVTPGMMQFAPEIEPLVGLLEHTPRDRCAAMVVEQLRNGVSYRRLLAALFLAGIRNINPRPPGFALHCVFVIHSAHLIGLEAPADSRLLPLFYALDNFKSAQERDARQQSGDYTMRPISGPLPAPGLAAAEFSHAMEAWDQERAERAVVSLARHRSAAEIFGMLWRHGARDYRNIGHKAIFVANACRTLHAIGWQHSEPVLRSLTLSLLDFGRERQVNGYAFDDQCYAANLKRLKETFPRLNDAWVAAPADAAATRSILETMRQSTPDEACADVAGRLAKGKTGAGTVWDAVHLAAAELSMRARASAVIVGIHSVSAADALHYSYLAASDPETRFLLLLQAVGWMVQFRTWAEAREDNLRSFAITDLEPSTGEAGGVAEIFAEVPEKRDAAAAHVFRLAQNIPDRQAFLTAALRLTLAKADEVHYYKYLAALIEDIPLVSANWQPHLLAATVYYGKGSNDADSATMKRAREALRSL
ncbi:MAG: hypothetical protein WD696_02275 [Bryobacteraceae bacterium]